MDPSGGGNKLEMNILITGATGNIGLEVVNQFKANRTIGNIIAGVRDIEKTKKNYPELNDIELRKFDFYDISTFDSALDNIDIMFLLRPPQISNIKKYIAPLITRIAEIGNIKIILLSVQGAETSTIIPHRKIELLIIKNKIDYIFLRPSYFMQNLTTTLYPEIQHSKLITLPSGTAKFNWIDISDISRIVLECASNFNKYQNKALTISGSQNLNFPEVVKLINLITNGEIKYRSVNPLKYFIAKKKEKYEIGMIFVMFVLHFLPRVQPEPKIVNTFYDIFNENPKKIEEFIRMNIKKFT